MPNGKEASGARQHADKRKPRAEKLAGETTDKAIIAQEESEAVLRIIFDYHWVQQGDYWILFNGLGRAVGMILVVQDTPSFKEPEQIEKRRVTV